MNTHNFLKLVGKMLDTQQNYFKNRLQGDLVQAKQLERDVRAVLKTGKLEPDEPVPTAVNLDMFNKANFCLWTRDDQECCWETTCKNAFVILSGGPEDNNFNFCPYCGKPIHEVKTIEAQE